MGVGFWIRDGTTEGGEEAFGVYGIICFVRFMECIVLLGDCIHLHFSV